MKVSKNHKRIGGLAIAALLVTGAVGTGAVQTLTSALSGNVFSANVPGKDDKPTGALVEVTGAPLVHTFDIKKFNDSVEGTWTITNKGTLAAPYDGTLAPTGSVPASLAKQLIVDYKDASGTWRNAGTLAAPVSYAKAVGIDNATLASGAKQTVPVRVSLADPSALEGKEGETLTLSATFTVSYVSDAA